MFEIDEMNLQITSQKCLQYKRSVLSVCFGHSRSK